MAHFVKCEHSQRRAHADPSRAEFRFSKSVSCRVASARRPKAITCPPNFREKHAFRSVVNCPCDTHTWKYTKRYCQPMLLSLDGFAPRFKDRHFVVALPGSNLSRSPYEIFWSFLAVDKKATPPFHHAQRSSVIKHHTVSSQDAAHDGKIRKCTR